MEKTGISTNDRGKQTRISQTVEENKITKLVKLLCKIINEFRQRSRKRSINFVNQFRKINVEKHCLFRPTKAKNNISNLALKIENYIKQSHAKNKFSYVSHYKTIIS